MVINLARGSGSGEDFDGSADAPLGDGVALRFQIIVGAELHCIFPFCVDEHGALFGLFKGMTAYFHQGLNHPLESIHLIVPYNQAAGIVIGCQHIRVRFFAADGRH